MTLSGSCSGDCNLVSGNTGDGVRIDGINVSLNKVEGNFIGTDLSGKISLPNGGAGVQVAGAHSNLIGGFPENAESPNPRRNLISGNEGFGILLVGASAKSNQIFGNWIGTDAGGEESIGNAGGIHLRFNSGNRIGWNIPRTGNVIAGNRGSGISLEESQNTLIQGNQIGVSESGKPMGNAGHGIHIENASTANTIGGDQPGMGNQIAHNQGDGVLISALHNNEILGNSIHDNQGMGIDLAPLGITQNDGGDVDLGANLLQNYPMLNGIFPGDGEIVVEGTLEGLPESPYRIEFFSNLICDPSENGEGEKYLGNLLVTTDVKGEALFHATLPHQGGPYITATATDNSKNTSEFCPCRLLGTGGVDLDLDQVFDNVDNCPLSQNSDQADADHDGFGDVCDTCPGFPDNIDKDGDGLADCLGVVLAGQGCGLSSREVSLGISGRGAFLLGWAWVLLIGLSIRGRKYDF